jgi:hypothetical protein
MDMTERPPLLAPATRAAILRRIHALRVEDLHALDGALAEVIAERRHQRAAKGYFFAWWDGPRLPREDEEALDDLFADALTALAEGLTGLDVERMAARFAPRPSVLDGLARLFRAPRPKRQLQDASISLIEDAVAPWDPRRAIVATWNMACAVTLRRHLPAATRETLEAAWRRALGDPPA